MSATAVCPCCSAVQPDSLLCTSCTDRFRTDLRGNAVHMGVAELVDNLHVAQAKLARGGDSGKPGPAHERMSLNVGAMDEVRNLEFYLGTWARDLTSDQWRPGDTRRRYVAVQCADILLEHMPDIRRHGAVEELVDEITKAIHKARNFLDVEPFTRFPVGPCPEECDRTVFAVCPAEGSSKPALMACYTLVKGENRPDLAAGFAHHWTSVQFFRAGERIRRKMEQTKGAA